MMDKVEIFRNKIIDLAESENMQEMDIISSCVQVLTIVTDGMGVVKCMTEYGDQICEVTTELRDPDKPPREIIKINEKLKDIGFNVIMVDGDYHVVRIS